MPVLQRALILAFVLLSFVVSSPATAVEWAIVGARAAGMGGAGVATIDDAMATYWNPAGLAMRKSFDIQGQATGQVVDRLGVIDTVEEINDLTRGTYTTPAQAAAAQQRAQALANRLNLPSATVSGAGSFGLYFKGFYGDHAFGVNVSDVATAGLSKAGGSTVNATCTSVGGVGGCAAGATNSVNVSGQFAVRGLEARQLAFSYAYGFLDRELAIGITGKVIQGAAYNNTINIQGTDAEQAFDDNIGKANISTAFGVDVGAIYRPSSWLRVGITGKDLNEPTFNAPNNGGEFKLSPQVRGGVAVNPYESLTIAFDGDLTSNRTMVPGLKSRILSLGAEQSLFDILKLRIGALKNVADAQSYITPTAGVGVKIWAFHADLAAGYDFRESGALVSGSLGFTF